MAGIVKLAIALLCVLVTDVAVRVMVQSPAGFSGAVYITGAPLPDVLDEIEPALQGAGEQLSVQLTPESMGSWTTVAANGAD